MISFACGNCGHNIQATSKLAGQTRSCPKCKKAVTIPGGIAAVTTATPSPPPNPSPKPRPSKPKATAQKFTSTNWLALRVLSALLMVFGIMLVLAGISNYFAGMESLPDDPINSAFVAIWAESAGLVLLGIYCAANAQSIMLAISIEAHQRDILDAIQQQN